ncbi:MAG TPA: hypothetical protein PLG77_03335 [Burkholderiaceae bacterium]|nr:hypothetical protein [Burkholderiaceae bacterium]
MNLQTINASASPEVQMNENCETLEHQAVYGLRQPVTMGLTWGYCGGRWGGFAITAGTLTLTDDSANYIVVAIATGVASVSAATTNWDDSANYVRVYKVTAASGAVTAVEDHRAGPLGVHGGGGGGGGVIESIVPGTGISVDDTDPANPIVAATGSSTVNVTPDTHPSSPNVADDEFEYGSSIDTSGARASGATAWAWVNQGAASAAVSGGSLVLAQGAQSTSDNLRCVMQPVSGSTWRFRAKVTLFGQRASADSSATAGIIFAGLCARNSTSGKLLSVHILSNAADTKPGRIEANRWTNVTTYSATYAATKDIFRGDYWNPRALVTLYLEIEQTSTQFLTRWSDSGVDGTFIPLTAENLSTHISSIDEVGIFHANTLNQTHTPKSATVVDWWRRMA